MKIQQWSSSDTFRDHKTCNDFSLRSRDGSIVLQLQSSHTYTNLLRRNGTSKTQNTHHHRHNVSTRNNFQNHDTQACKIIWREIQLVKMQRSSKSIWHNMEKRNIKQGRLSLQKPSSETLHRESRWVCDRHAIINAVNIWAISYLQGCARIFVYIKNLVPRGMHSRWDRQATDIPEKEANYRRPPITPTII